MVDDRPPPALPEDPRGGSGGKGGGDEDCASSEEDERPEGTGKGTSVEALAQVKAKAKPKAKPQAHKGPEARARDERVAANNVLYESLSDEELEKVLPKTSEGKTTSIGAMLHASALCAVCIFHHSPKGCYNGPRCKFCHAEHDQPVRPKRRRKALDGSNGEHPGEAATEASGERARRARKRPRRRQQATRVQEGENSSSDRDAGSPLPCNAALDYGSAWGAEPADGGSDWPLLDERGNSRPSWLQHEHPSHSWPYGWLMPAPGGYGLAPLPQAFAPSPGAPGWPVGCNLPPAVPSVMGF